MKALKETPAAPSAVAEPKIFHRKILSLRDKLEVPRVSPVGVPGDAAWNTWRTTFRPPPRERDSINSGGGGDARGINLSGAHSCPVENKGFPVTRLEWHQ